ncbi:MAG: hypothetical protein PHQ35_11395 [Phycisphaerae bacterium]|nr:hypothetical protein [Phycisphaerae bacterium]MDD5382025.1 hypothetical protein [Phycisphaerae bacterium]
MAAAAKNAAAILTSAVAAAHAVILILKIAAPALMEASIYATLIKPAAMALVASRIYAKVAWVANVKYAKAILIWPVVMATAITFIIFNAAVTFYVKSVKNVAPALQAIPAATRPIAKPAWMANV